MPWHDNGWNGTVCKSPIENGCCLSLKRIYEGKDEQWEESVRGTHWDDLGSRLPPCKVEAAAFMSSRSWTRTFQHPYQNKKGAHHTHLLPTDHPTPPFASHAVPYWWMLRESQKAIDEAIAEPLPPDDPPPFPSAWVYPAARQERLLDLFFDRIEPSRSLVFFYCKNGNPFDDTIGKLVVGAGTVTAVDEALRYRHDGGGGPDYPIWDRVVHHSIRPGRERSEGGGFLVPYHDYLAPTGDDEEDSRRLALLRDVAVAVGGDQYDEFSYGASHLGHDSALVVLRRLLDVVRLVREHGVADGPWDRHEQWVNDRIAASWEARGDFPGLGPALEAFGIRHGTALAYDLFTGGLAGEGDDPWPVVDAILRGRQAPPRPAYKGDIDALAPIWTSMSERRRTLLSLLSRFALTPSQAKRWFSEQSRPASGVSDEALIANPYLIAELDVAAGMERAVPLGTVDAGLFPSAATESRNPVPAPSAAASPLDPRRIRAALTDVLKTAAYEGGDTLLSESEGLEAVRGLPLPQPCDPPPEWIPAHADALSERVRRMDVRGTPALQLNELHTVESRLEKILVARAAKPLPPLSVAWSDLLVRAITTSNPDLDAGRLDADALSHQTAALERIVGRKLGVLLGPAGTGKTSVLGALLNCGELKRGGVLLLAPTGKARVRLGRMAGAEAFTIAQFLTHQERFDWEQMRPRFDGGTLYRQARTVIIDECSMVTVEDLYAVFQALDPAHVTRILLVGDPNQLPPIGPGRPFADLCAYLDVGEDEEDTKRRAASGALAKLNVVVRQAAEGPSDILRLASWFTSSSPEPGADEVFDKLTSRSDLVDLDIVYWREPEELGAAMLEAMTHEFGLDGPEDVAGFNRLLGFEPYENGWIYPYERPGGAERFQVLSPVRHPGWGVLRINRLFQETFRGSKLKYQKGYGSQRIVKHDKVIQTVNQRRDGYAREHQRSDRFLVANGEIGVAATSYKGYLNVAFAGRPGLTFGYKSREFGGDSGPLDLAYAITVHKAQGSEFEAVFAVIPESGRLLSRELLYTALTRARGRLVLFVQGSDPGLLYALSAPDRSETARRNGNLLIPSVRAGRVDVPFAEHLIHRTEGDLFVRSKSEVIIANMLHREGVPFEYERKFEGETERGTRYPDFTFFDPAGDAILWEHLGMLHRESYRHAWDEKKRFYEANGYAEGVNLFVTRDSDAGAIDSNEIRATVGAINSLV